MKNIKIILIPGNGNCSIHDNWYQSVGTNLKSHGFNVILREFPDRELARQEYWIPFLHDDLNANEHTILIGHSSGAVAAMRYAEKYPILGSVIVSAYHTDLGMETEKFSGYFSEIWNWDKIRANQKFISVIASQDDPWIPITEPRYIQSKLECEYHEFTNQGHFGRDCNKNQFPEITQIVLNNTQKINE